MLSELQSEPTTILLVEDNEFARESIAAQLTYLGYRVHVATDGPQALAQLDEVEGIDLLISDVVMPGGMSGQKLGEEVKSRYRHLPVLLISAHPQEQLLALGKIDKNAYLLNKPFRIAELQARIQVLLAN